MNHLAWSHKLHHDVLKANKWGKYFQLLHTVKLLFFPFQALIQDFIHSFIHLSNQYAIRICSNEYKKKNTKILSFLGFYSSEER